MSQHRPWTRQEETVLLEGSFGTDASGAIDATIQRGKGYTPTRVSAGLYRVTYDTTYPAKIAATAAILKSTVADLECQVQQIDTTNKRLDIQVVRTGITGINWPKDAVDGAASTATAETAIGCNPGAATVRSVYIVPTAALTADDTNYATITVWKRDSNGANQTKVAEQTTKITGGSGNWTAFKPVALTLQAAANLALAAGGSLTVQIAKAGTGVAVPISVVVVEMSSKIAADLLSGEIHFDLVMRNTGIA